ncbi:hypothetical protein Dda3937_03459 [Dickeya dadantii 3937]|uniref:Uncharacterized protein n=1 Tax=Dickeya dadantii (strain 3937) TaxID=198628 RepID=E0SF95_DICD3|nr:hypothetical protein Dda3937_03459 [Dickeya dadantii 3937]
MQVRWLSKWEKINQDTGDFKLQVRWLSSLTPVTYLSKLPGIRCVAALLQLELFRVSVFFN